MSLIDFDQIAENAKLDPENRQREIDNAVKNLKEVQGWAKAALEELDGRAVDWDDTHGICDHIQEHLNHARRSLANLK